MSDPSTAPFPGSAAPFNPYPGLRSFEPDEDHLFFGREHQIDELLARLRRSHFLPVLGASGSGKSSLVRSGLIPSLHSGFMVQAGSSWKIALMRPGNDPIGNLARALGRPEVLGVDTGPVAAAELRQPLIETALLRSSQGLVDAVRQAHLAASDNLLVVVDQFEELFRFKQSLQIEDCRDHALAFVKLLLEAAHQDEVPIFIVLTMRSDFLGNCTEFPGLAEAVNLGAYLVPRMTREERRAAIVGPAAVGGAEISARLVTRLLNDVGDDPDQLPILQHALMRTWDHWQEHHAPDEPIDLRHYEAIGTLSRALSQHAEEAYQELANDDQRWIAEVLFKALTDLGSDARGIRRPRRLEEISALTGASGEEVRAVVECFRRPGRTFLMPPAGTPIDGASILDISHESLMRIWKRLIDWAEEEARSAQVYVRLARTAARHEEGKAGLLRDPELQLALNWRAENRPTAAWAMRYDPDFERAMEYLDASEKARDLHMARRERERRKQLRRTRWLAVFMGSAAAAMLALGLVAYERQLDAEQSASDAQRSALEAKMSANEAQRQRQIADRERSRAQEKEVEAKDNAERARDNALRAARNAERAKRNAERAALSEAEARRNEARAQESASLAHRKEQDALEAKESAIAAQKTALEQKDRADRLGQIQAAHALALQALRMRQPDQHELATLLALEAYRLNQREEGPADDPDIYAALRQSLENLDPQRQTVVRGFGDAVRSLALAADGHTLAMASDDGTVRRIDLRKPRDPPKTLATLGAPVRAVAFAPQGLRLAAATFDGALRLWDLERPDDPPRQIATPGGALDALAFDPDGRHLVAGGASCSAWVVDLDAEEARSQQPPPGTCQRTFDLAFDPGGERLAAATDGGVLLWDLGRPDAAPAVLAAGRTVRSVAFDAGGATLAAGTDDGPILLLDPRRPEAPARAELLGHASGVSSLAFATAGRPLLASAALDGNVRLWDPRDPDHGAVRLNDHGAWVWALVLTQDARQVITGGADRTVRISWTEAAPLVAEACVKVSRDLTPDERHRYLPGDLAYQPTCPNLNDAGR